MIADDRNLRNFVFPFLPKLLLYASWIHWGPVMCYPDPHSAGGPNGGLPFRLKLIAKNFRKRKPNGRKRHAKTYKNLEFYQLPRCVQRHWTHFYFPWIGVMLILWGCYGMVGWPRWVAVYCVCNADVWLFQRGSTSRFSWKREIRGQCEMFAKCPEKSNKMDGTFTIQHMLHFRCWFRWRPCCKTLLKLSEVPREAVLNSYFEIVRKDSQEWQKEHFHLTVIFYTYTLFTNQ